MKKLLPLLLCLFLFVGCEGKPLPAGMEESKVLDAGRQVVISLTKGEYEAVAEQFREDIRTTLDAEQLRSLVEAAAKDAGIYKELTDSMVTGRSSDGTDYAVAVFWAKYEKENLLFEAAFDPDMALIGLRVEKK